MVPTIWAKTPPRSMSATRMHRAAGHLGDPQVGDVVGFEVDLGDAAGPLDDDEVVGSGAAVRKLSSDLGECLRLVGVVLRTFMLPTAVPGRSPGSPVSELGLSSTGFMSVWGGMPQAWRLHRLGPADLAPFRGDGGVERHVLRLERARPPCRGS